MPLSASYVTTTPHPIVSPFYIANTLNLPLFLAKRLYSQREEQRQVSHPAIRIATAGVAIGLAVMIISVSVVFGFKHTIRDKIIGFGGHIQVANFMTLQMGEQYPIQMGDSMLKVLKGINGVTHVQRYAIKQGILKTNRDFLGVAFKGIAQDYDTAFLHQHIVEGSIPKFSDKKSSGDILISKIMQDLLGLKTGDKIFAYFIDANGVRVRRFKVAGVYDTNLTRFDKVTCFIDLYTANKLNGWEYDQTSGAELNIKDFYQLDIIASNVANKVNRGVDKYGSSYSSQDVKTLNPQTFSWLGLLDLNVWIILGLMVAVAAVTMISGLLIIILERTTMIGVLKALGANNSTIRKTFLWFAAFIIGRGLLIGDVVALALLLLQSTTGIVKLDPTTYYVSTVPIEINPIIILLLNVATLLLCVFVLIAPSYIVSHIRPAKSMRYE